MSEVPYALITGATSGIGKELSTLFAKNGINLILSGRNESALEELKAALSLENITVIIVKADLLNQEDRKIILEFIHRYGPEYVINNAGFGLYGDCLTYTTKEQLDILEVNGKAVLELTLEAARTLFLKGKKGVIVNLSSAASFQIFPGFAVYTAAKAFVKQFSQTLDIETRPYGIRVLTVCPGMVETEFSARAGGKKDRMEKGMTMSVEYVANEIWEQIQSRQALKIIDWRYRILVFITSILPKRWLAGRLHEKILRRIGHSTR